MGDVALVASVPPDAMPLLGPQCPKSLDLVAFRFPPIVGKTWRGASRLVETKTAAPRRPVPLRRDRRSVDVSSLAQ